MNLARSASFLLFLASSAAAAADDEDWCRNGLFPIQSPSPGLAVIAGRGRAYFLGDMDGCPSPEARCRQRTYVVPGDRVVTGQARAGYVCVYYPSRGGGTAGWMDAARLTAREVDQNPPLSAWVGQWSENGNPRIRFVRRAAGLLVDGESYWPSPNPSPRDYPGGPNEGAVSEAVQVRGNSAHASECNITFRLLGDLLIAADPDMSCGGMNVSFSGVYRRERR